MNEDMADSWTLVWLSWILCTFALTIGLAIPLGFHFQSIFLLMVAFGLAIGFLPTAGIGLALFENSAWKRVLSTCILPTASGLAGVWLACLWVGWARTGGLNRIEGIVPGSITVCWYIICFASCFWLLRIFRGWKLVEFENDREFTIDKVELGWAVGTSLVAFALGVWASNFAYALLLEFVAGLAVGVLLFAPLTYGMMKFRRPMFLWLIACIALPLIILAGFGIYDYSQHGVYGVQLQDWMYAYAIAAVFAMVPTATFLWLLRWQGYRLQYASPSQLLRKKKETATAPKKHPLDD